MSRTKFDRDLVRELRRTRLALCRVVLRCLPQRWRARVEERRRARLKGEVERAAGRHLRLGNRVLADCKRLGRSEASLLATLRDTLRTGPAPSPTALGILAVGDMFGLVTCDRTQLTVWRVLSASELTQPLERCLGAFQRATALDYRILGARGLLFSHDRKRLIRVLRTLHGAMMTWCLVTRKPGAALAAVQSLIDEVERATFAEDGMTQTITTAESFISRAHRMIVNAA